MKKLLPLAIFLTSFFFTQKAVSQTFPSLNVLLEYLTEEQRTDFFDQIENLDINELGGYLQESGGMDQLLTFLNGDLPYDELGSLLNTFDSAGIYLDEWLGNLFGLSDEDLNAILNQVNNVEDVFANYDGTFDDLFAQYQDSISSDLPVIQIPGDLDNDILLENFENALNLFPEDTTQGVQNVIDQLFDRDVFSSMEIAYGRKAAIVDWYGTRREIGMQNLQVIRVGTVPSFNNDFEPFWSGTVSWSNNQFGLVTGSEANAVEDKFNPFIFEGDFGVMYNPSLPFPGLANGRLITRLGFEVAAYAPPHINTDKVRTLSNIGKTTGSGAQIGTGYEITVGQLSTYVMGIASFGSVNNSPDPYAYSNLKIEVGARFGDVINVRYSHGQQDWARKDHKRVNTRNQFTIGIIMDELFN